MKGGRTRHFKLIATAKRTKFTRSPTPVYENRLFRPTDSTQKLERMGCHRGLDALIGTTVPFREPFPPVLPDPKLPLRLL